LKTEQLRNKTQPKSIQKSFADFRKKSEKSE